MKLFEKFSFDNEVIIEGLTNELSAFYVLECFKREANNIIVLASNLYIANQIFHSLETYTDQVLLFPMDDFFTSVAIAVSPELKLKRLETLEKLKTGKHIVVTNLMGYLHFLPNKKEQENLEITLKREMEISRDRVVQILDSLGYQRDSIVTSTGEYSVRGFIVDVFFHGEDHPVRIEFFGDTIEEIRYFDEESQLSLEKIDQITCQANEEIRLGDPNSLYDYMNDVTLISLDKEQILASYEKLNEEAMHFNEEENTPSKRHFWYFEELHPRKSLYLNQVTNEINKDVKRFHTAEIENYRGDFTKLHDQVFSYIHQGKTVLFALSKDSQIKLIKGLFDEIYLLKDDELLKNKIQILQTKINRGFIWDDLVVISEFDIEEIKEEKVYKNPIHIGKKVSGLDVLSLGDYVVHRVHGIGIYNGVVTLENHGIKKDYIQITYLGNDKIYIPVEKISTIYKYSDADGMKPQINKLGSTAWQKKKQSIQKRIHDISKELIELYAKRNQTVGEAYVDYPEEEIFAKSFIYDETRDQTRAIHDVLHDLDSTVPMDRLLCGDVGFGKTEVAFRGMFKTVCNNHQVMYLCPTTILSKQQYESALDRFKDYPVEIALLNRFTTPKEVKRILHDLELGKIDIVFGTHRLLSDDVKFKRLGLLIVDEEQRFGVTHKEKIKKYKNDVNVLTLSATPIPRTLKMALSGLRDLSIIDTPPINRYPVQTYVVAESDLLIKDAIYKELARGGQIFILYNRIDSIEDILFKLRRLVPEARIRYAHGRMNKQELDTIMEDFIDQKFDVLLSTTIIETGIDIPNANTLIIYNADYFGLSQLYQLRGRVGRSNKIAYAYLMYQKNKMLNDIAVKRLQAIRDFTELGSGYKIAMRDLSIRGAGDILGSEQAGFVDSVGISLYMKMIEEEMKRLKGEEVIEEDSKESLINVETHITKEYVEDESVRIEIHQMINEIDSYEKLENVKSQLEDRFGMVTKEMEIYMYEEWFEKLAERLKITDVRQTDRNITIVLPEEVSSKIKGDKLFLEAYSINPKFQLKYENKKIYLSLNLLPLKTHFIFDVVKLIQKIALDLEV